jgi:hypothetical protein
MASILTAAEVLEMGFYTPKKEDYHFVEVTTECPNAAREHLQVLMIFSTDEIGKLIWIVWGKRGTSPSGRGFRPFKNPDGTDSKVFFIRIEDFTITARRLGLTHPQLQKLIEAHSPPD